MRIILQKARKEKGLTYNLRKDQKGAYETGD